MTAPYDRELFKLKAELCKTFSDPTRLMILNELRGVVSRHLAVLRNRGIVAARREGVNMFYHLSNSKIIEACDIVHEVLMEQVARNRELADRFI